MSDMKTVVISQFGTHAGLTGERLVVREKGEVLEEIPLFRLRQVTIGKRGVSISSDLIRECALRGIRIAFLDGAGRPFALLSSPDMVATAKTRRAQLSAFEDERGADFCRFAVSGKLHNQANLLKYLAKNLAEGAPVLHELLQRTALSIETSADRAKALPGSHPGELRGPIMAIEGSAGRAYWDAITTLLDRPDFKGREHRGARDPVNASLNYGYGVLQSRVWSAALAAGLDVNAGFLHVDRPGKPSLILDLIEEFRQPIVDRAVIAAFKRERPIAIDPATGLLEDASKRTVANEILERLATPVIHRGRRISLESVVQCQAYSLAVFLRREGRYRAYRFAW